MSDDTHVGEYVPELPELQETATKARATADQLKSALTDQSSDEEKKAATDAEEAAAKAESAYATAKAKAEADAAAQGGGAAKAGDTCPLPDGTEGVLTDQEGQLVCVSKELPAIDPDASRTGYVTDAKGGDECTCPDGRKGTVHKFDNGLVCIPNADQS